MTAHASFDAASIHNMQTEGSERLTNVRDVHRS